MRGTDIYQTADVGKPTYIDGWTLGWFVGGWALILEIPMDGTRYTLQVGNNPQVFYDGAWHSLSEATITMTNHKTFIEIAITQHSVPNTYRGQAMLFNLGLTAVNR